MRRGLQGGRGASPHGPDHVGRCDDGVEPLEDGVELRRLGLQLLDVGRQLGSALDQGDALGDLLVGDEVAQEGGVAVVVAAGEHEVLALVAIDEEADVL